MDTRTYCAAAGRRLRIFPPQVDRDRVLRSRTPARLTSAHAPTSAPAVARKSCRKGGVRKAFVALTLLLASCKGCEESDPPKAKDAGAPPSAAPEAAAPVEKDAGAPIDAASLTEEIYADAGSSDCRLAYGPAEQPFRGPAALDVSGNELRVVVNEGGRARVYPVTIPPKKAPRTPPPRPSSFIGMRWPPCELAGKHVYCSGQGGVITRGTLGGTDWKPVPTAKIRNGTKIAAALLDGEHSVVAWLESRDTTEGPMLKAFASMDLGEPERLSDDGAGATSVRLFRRTSGVVAVYLDTRTNQVPIHARPVLFRNNGLAFGTDVVVAVGGVPERGIDFEVGVVGERAFALIPMPKDTLDFGMATVPIEDPPKEDVGLAWSPYPNGIDPAPIASTPTKDGKGAWIVRTRPRERSVGSPRILELGKMDVMGVFTSLGEIAPGKNVTDITAVEDTAGSVWILYGDATVTYLERRVCD